MRECIICGSFFEYPPVKNRVSAKRKRFTCSERCHHILAGRQLKGRPSKKRLPLPQLACKRCGKDFQSKRYYPPKHLPQYCSKECRYKDWPTGDRAWGWKGGRTKNAGYVLINMPKHPYANKVGFVREHRLIMEKYLDRYLLPTERVHHLNGITDDNRIENLELISTQKMHKSIHPNIICPHCHKEFVLISQKPINSFM